AGGRVRGGGARRPASETVAPPEDDGGPRVRLCAALSAAALAAVARPLAPGAVRAGVAAGRAGAGAAGPLGTAPGGAAAGVGVAVPRRERVAAVEGRRRAADPAAASVFSGAARLRKPVRRGGRVPARPRLRERGLGVGPGGVGVSLLDAVHPRPPEARPAASRRGDEPLRRVGRRGRASGCAGRRQPTRPPAGSAHPARRDASQKVAPRVRDRLSAVNAPAPEPCAKVKGTNPARGRRETLPEYRAMDRKTLQLQPLRRWERWAIALLFVVFVLFGVLVEKRSAFMERR